MAGGRVVALAPKEIGVVSLPEEDDMPTGAGGRAAVEDDIEEDLLLSTSICGLSN